MARQISLRWSLEKIAGLQKLVDSIERGENKYTWEYIVRLAILEASSTLKEYDKIEAENKAKEVVDDWDYDSNNY
jgi:hypothetical protein